MIETFDFRLFESAASRLLPDAVGDRLSDLARRLVARSDSPEYSALAAADQKARDTGEQLIASWGVRRRYSQDELSGAGLLRVYPARVFEPAGEICGTEYDDDRACSGCGRDAPQLTPLALPERRIPSAAVSRTIAHEYVVSSELVQAIERSRLRGFEFAPIHDCGPKAGVLPDAHQLRLPERSVNVVEPTIWGNTPFDAGIPGCPTGHSPGLNVISDVSIERESWDGADLCVALESEGRRAGVLRPGPLLFISQRAHQALADAGVRGFAFEVALLV